jgi:hypothetical protein
MSSTGRLITGAATATHCPSALSFLYVSPQRECPPGPWTAATRSQRTGARECNAGWDLGKRTATCFDGPARTLADYQGHVLHARRARASISTGLQWAATLLVDSSSAAG